ncbi:TniQ family protein [Brevibacterium senegalense]|uniref:TniQ family protein n=1 Tax=Brevibacterium senegalense TaxID=1033736 RepID=UPI00036E3232|nr:TniQ family protein [Brevibacterium senegalense]
MISRWPVHPRPIPGEALTLWLHRIADEYGTTIDDLTFDIGYSLDRNTDLDLAPPEGLIEQLTIRTGVSTDHIRLMSISGYTPWLLDDIEPSSDAFSTYIRQLAVLLPERNLRRRTVDSWRAWVPTPAVRHYRACPHCVRDSTPPRPYLVTWSLPLMLSCPFHHCWLEHHDGPPGYYYAWRDPSSAPEPQRAAPAIRRMDDRTWQALTTGTVNLPRHCIHAGTWFRLLRTLIDELGATMSDCGAAQRLTREVWQRTGYPVRAGQAMWRPFETQTPQKQQRTLEAAANAMRLLENSHLTGLGREAALFLPEPDASIDPGKPQQTTTADSPGAAWKAFSDAVDAAVEEARQNPDSARQLFNLMTLYRRADDEHTQRVRTNFEELGIPLDYLSQ